MTIVKELSQVYTMSNSTNGGKTQVESGTRAIGFPMLLSQSLDVFLEDYVWLRGYSEKTADNYRLAVNSFVRVVGDIPIESVSIEDIKLWKHHLDRTLERNGVAAYMYKVRLFLRWCDKRYGLNLDLDDLVIPKRSQKLPRYLKCEEVQKLLDSVPDNRFPWVKARNQAIVALFYSSGVRLGELCRIRLKDIRDNEITVRGKGDKERIAFIDPRAKEYIDQYLRIRPSKGEFLFDSVKCDRMSSSCVQQMLRQTALNAGLSASAHTMRHSFATNLLQSGCNLRYIQELLGHADISTTQIYTHASPSDAKSAYLKYHKVV